MLSEIKSLPGVKVLTKEEQKNLKGGKRCCDPLITCCIPASSCGSCGGTCHCSSGCSQCEWDGFGTCTCL